MRIIAASLVFINHGLIYPLFTNADLNDAYKLIGHNTGTVGVSFFFILSGFVLTWSAKPNDTTLGFWRRRFLKIFPNHVVVWLAVLAMMGVAGLPIMWGPTLWSLPLLQGWFPEATYHLFAVNGPTWSLSVELLFYAAFPLLLPLILKIPAQRLWLWAGVVTVGGLLMPVVARLFLPEQPPSMLSTTLSWPQQWFVYFFPPIRIFEFVVGMIMARIVLSGRWIGLRPILATLLLLAVYAATMGIDLIDGWHGLLLAPMALLIAAVASSDVAGRTGVLTRPAMVWLGQISYAFFLVHVHVLFLIHAAFGGQFGVRGAYKPEQFGVLGGIALLVGVYLASVVVAWLLYALVEQPIMRNWSRSRQRRTAADAQPAP
ncbi:acyltransferase family protein [Phytohabitans flavus]|uniref:acyltransferase family protein n=1 Tax=Phytohabitans flavus TaxID=1076124 RepID=UPI00366AC017